MPEGENKEILNKEDGARSEVKSWILDDPKELNEIKNKTLRGIIGALEKTPSILKTPERLGNFYEKIENFTFVEKKIPEEEAGIFLGKIGNKLEEIDESSGKEKEILGKEGKKETSFDDELIEKLSKKARELDSLGAIKLGEDDKRSKELFERITNLQEQMMELIKQGASGEGFMSGTEKPPTPEKGNGVDELKDWFSKRIRALIHEYPDQSFETNWTLVWPLQQAISKLWPKEGRGDSFEIPVDLKDVNGQPLKDAQGYALREMKEYKYSDLRREFARELEAFRNIHNFRFIYRRVSGVGDVIGAAGLLENRYVEYLLHNKDIADSLRELEKLGNEYKNSDDKEKILVKEKMEGIVDLNWQGKVSSALYSILGRSWKHDIIFNESGDFFCGRLFNMPDWAKRRWEKDWQRKPFPKLYDALDLRVDDFWDEALKGLSKKEGEEKLKNLNIEFTYNNKTKKREYSFKSAKFEKLNFKELQLKNEKFTNDQMRHVVLDLEEADHIRKKILNPRGLLDEPGLQHIDGIYEEFKHLKGEKRSEWMEEVIKQIVFYFKDQRAPDIDDLPQKIRKCQAQEINSDYVGWTNRHIIAAINGLTPPLTEKDKEDLLTEVVGPKFLRGLKSVSKATASVGGSAIFGAVKGFFGEFFKFIFGGK